MYNSGISTSQIDSTRYPELRKWVVASLAGHKKPNDIIFQLCRRTGWDWGQAKQFLEQVAESNQKEIHQRRMPLLLGIGILFMAAGAISFFSAYTDLAEILSTLEPPLDLEKIVNAVLMARSIYLLAVKLVLGMAGVVGGGYGIWSALQSAITGEGEELVKSDAPK
jgi:hypothetical protein